MAGVVVLMALILYRRVVRGDVFNAGFVALLVANLDGQLFVHRFGIDEFDIHFARLCVDGW